MQGCLGAKALPTQVTCTVYFFVYIVHYKTRIGRSTSPAGNDCLDPYFGLSCVIGWVQPYWVCRRIFWAWPWSTIFWEIPCGGLFRYYLPGNYKFNRVIECVVLWFAAVKYCRTDCIVDLIPCVAKFEPNSGQIMSFTHNRFVVCLCTLHQTSCLLRTVHWSIWLGVSQSLPEIKEVLGRQSLLMCDVQSWNTCIRVFTYVNQGSAALGIIYCPTLLFPTHTPNLLTLSQTFKRSEQIRSKVIRCTFQRI